VLTAFLAILVFSQLVSERVRIPYTLLLVFVGIAVTVLPSLPSMGSALLTNSLTSLVLQMRSSYDTLVQGGLFVGLVVPPLIFEAMMHVRAPDLRAVVRPSLVLATAGVIIATAVGGIVLWHVAGLSFASSFLFAAIVSPTDIVTVLEIFRRVDVPSKLATMMDMEAAFNDATGIIVFSVVLSSIGLQRVPVLSSVSQFIFTLAGGAAVGLVVAVIARRINAMTKDKIAKTTLTISAVYGSYVLAAGLGVSGLIAVAMVGLYFGNVMMSTATDTAGKEAVATFWEMAAFLGNSVAFLLIGFETDILAVSGSILLILAAYLAVTAARAASVYPILAVFNQVGERIPISWSNASMLGGMRGALSIALAASVGASGFLPDNDVRTITTMVLGVVFLSIVIQAPLLSRYAVRRLRSQQQQPSSINA